MRKFRHKKTETIAEINELDQNYRFERTSGEYSSIEYLHKSFVENSNDWEEVIEFITEVKRNRDGVIFKIGDKVKSVDDILTIKYFTHNGTLVHFKEIDEHDSVDNLEKITDMSNQWYIEKKSPIYTTTDGVEIFEGDRVTLFPLRKDLTIGTLRSFVVVKAFSNQDKEVTDRYLTFTSEENRDKYIKENTKKPIFVAADGKEMKEGDIIYHFYKPFEFIMHKSIVRHNTIYGDIIFYTEEKAKEYIDNNKPKYSLSDVQLAICSAAGLHRDIIGEDVTNELKKLGK